MTMMSGGPNALYQLPRAEQAQVLGWYAATRFDEGWRTKQQGRRRRQRVEVASADAERFWLGGE